MALSLQQIIARESMLELIANVKSGVARPFPEPFYRSDQKVEGDSGKYLRVDGTRKMARLVQYGSPSRRRELAGVTEVPVKLMHTFEHQVHGPLTLQKLIPTDGAPLDGVPTPQQKMGMSEIKRQTALFRMGFDNLRNSAIAMALGRGVIYVDGSGNIQNTSSGAAFAIDFGIPAGNKGQLNYNGGGAIIGASWATAGTDIIGDMEHLHQAAMELTGFEIAHAFYGRNILNYLLGNTKLGAAIAGNPADAAAFSRRMIPDGFLKVGKWHPAFHALFQEDGGTYNAVIPDDTIVFTPEPSPEWWDVIEGTFVVPRNVGVVAADAIEQLRQMDPVTGMFQYAHIGQVDPPSITQFAGDTFLPVIKVPSAVFIADVTP